MRRCASFVLVAVMASASALADPYDIRVQKLGNPSPGGANFSPAANARFRAFAREYAAALTSVNLMPPETLGHAGFALNAELSAVTFNQSEFDVPTQRLDSGAGTDGIEGALLIPSVHVRKGLPWSFELGGRAAWIEKSGMAAATGEVKWALNEGFTFLPDLGARGFVTRLFNTKDFDLTAAGLDLGLGKQFAVGGMITLTPYAGWNLVWVAASSKSIDFNQSRDYAETLSTPNAQFTDTGVYDEVTMGANSHNRFYGGVRFIGGALQLGAEYSYSQLPRIRVPTGNGDETTEQNLPAVTAFNFTVGLDF